MNVVYTAEVQLPPWHWPQCASGSPTDGCWQHGTWSISLSRMQDASVIRMFPIIKCVNCIQFFFRLNSYIIINYDQRSLLFTMVGWKVVSRYIFKVRSNPRIVEENNREAIPKSSLKPLLEWISFPGPTLSPVAYQGWLCSYIRGENVMYTDLLCTLSVIL